MPFKYLMFWCLLIVAGNSLHAQHQKKLQKAWIKKTVEDLSGKNKEPNTSYTRYTFDKSGTWYVSFYPGWDDYKREWSVNINDLTLGFDTYKIEELTDSSLIISLNGFRRVTLLSEDYVSSQDKNLIPMGTFNDKPLYKANDFITPRYATKTSLSEFIQQDTERFNIKKATYFLATFIVTEKGEVEDIQVVKGIKKDFDAEIVKQLKKTSKKWKPAYFKGVPVQTQMFYDIKYLDSLTPVERLN
jgi:hypothetical protein